MTKGKVTVSAPGKLLLCGDHAVVYGYPAIVTAVNQRLFVTVESLETTELWVTAEDVGVEVYRKSLTEIGSRNIPRPVVFLETAYAHFSKAYPHPGGVKISTANQFSSLFGFGSSSAVTVACLMALAKLFKIELSKKKLFDLSYAVVKEVQGVGSGFDIAAAVWGGTFYYVSPAKVVQQLNVKELPIVVGYTGIKADTATLIKKVADRKKTDSSVEKIFVDLTTCTEGAREAIEKKDWLKLGQIFHDQQTLLRQLEVSSSELEKLISAVEAAGAAGAKLSGAGGGDCMIAVVLPENKHKVEEAIIQAGGRVLTVEYTAEGAK